MADGETKTCPFCKEQIHREAVKCRFCGEWIEERAKEHFGPDTATGSAPTRTEKYTCRETAAAPCNRPQKQRLLERPVLPLLVIVFIVLVYALPMAVKNGASGLMGIAWGTLRYCTTPESLFALVVCGFWLWRNLVKRSNPTIGKSIQSEGTKPSLPHGFRPKLVTATAATWITLGVFTLLFGVTSGVLASVSSPELLSGAVFYIGFGIAVVYVGVRTLRQKARDTAGNSIGLLALGAFLLVPALLAIPSAGILAMIIALPGLGLISGGVLGLIARSDYRRWKSSQVELAPKAG